MRKAAVLLLSVFVVLLIVGGLITQSLVIMQRVAAVRDVQGMVWVRTRGTQDFKPLADAARVQAGDVIRTGDRAGLTLNWLDGTRIRIGANSVMTVLKCQINSATKADTALFKLDVGRLWIRVLKALSHKSKFEIRTPTATAGVKGTVFSVAVTPSGETTISVQEGQVHVDAAGQATEVTSGKMASAGTSGANVGGLSAEEAKLWDENRSVALPHLELSEPKSGMAVAPGTSLEVKGRTELDANVKVNGQAVPLGLRGMFKTVLVVPGNASGDFKIAVTATDARGYEARSDVVLKVN